MRLDASTSVARTSHPPLENYLHRISNPLEIHQELVNARVTAAKWYWSGHDQTSPLIIEPTNSRKEKRVATATLFSIVTVVPKVP